MENICDKSQHRLLISNQKSSEIVSLHLDCVTEVSVCVHVCLFVNVQKLYLCVTWAWHWRWQRVIITRKKSNCVFFSCYHICSTFVSTEPPRTLHTNKHDNCICLCVCSKLTVGYLSIFRFDQWQQHLHPIPHSTEWKRKRFFIATTQRETSNYSVEVILH